MNMLVTGFMFGIGFSVAQAIVSAVLNLIAKRTQP
jgi:high-affinity nickel permease